MPNLQKDQLFILIKSLTKAEKRNFKLYASRSQSGVDSKFLQLFDALDRMSAYDEMLIFKKVASIKKKHIANLKRHLYKQILTSLRLIYIQKNIDIQIREQIDFARILYGKGMYMQSLRLLERIKQIAVDHHQDVLHLEILEFQKLIETRHVTYSRQVENKVERLLMESLKRSQITHDINLLSALNIQMHGYYIQFGHIQTAEEKEKVKIFFNTHMPEGLDKRQLAFFEKVNLFQSRMWYHYINLDWPQARESAGQWVNLFMEDSRLSKKDPDLYIRGLYYFLVFHFLTNLKEDFRHYLQHMEEFIVSSKEDLNDNSKMLACVYYNLSKLNCYLLFGQFAEGIAEGQAIQDELSLYSDYMDEYRWALFDFKFAYLHFGTADFEVALDYLNKIVLVKHTQLPKNLHIYASLLQLMCLYETQQYDLMMYFIPPLSRTLNKLKERNQTQIVLLDFLKKIASTPPSEATEAFELFKRQDLLKLSQSPFEAKALHYLQPDVWVKSHLENRSVQEVAIVM